MAPPARRLAEASARSPLAAAAVGVWAIIGILVLMGLGIWILIQVRVILPPLVLAIALIVVLNPVVTWLQKRRVPRGLGTMLMYVLFFGLLTVVGMLVVPAVSRQVQSLVNDWPELQQRGLDEVQKLADRYNFSFDEQNVQELLKTARDQTGAALRQVTKFTAGALHLLLIFVLAPVLALYLLIDLPRLEASFIAHLPPSKRDEWLTLARRCGQAVSAFFRGQLAVALIVGTLSSILLAIARIPFALPIGLLAGLFNIIPFVGPFVGGGVAVVVGAVSGGPPRALLAALAMLAVQQLDNHFISPAVMGRAVRLHPVSIILALLGGGTLAGVFGMLLSVPTLAVAKILFMHYYSKHVLGLPATETAQTPAAPSEHDDGRPVAPVEPAAAVER
jgi:predicted PurR-regulated permease PerM